jgi:asparagine synthase (glutamine-hydrolysing)
MFAFAIWDSKKRCLFLARDRLGIKPLYYAQLGTKFVFASEPKAIVSLPFFHKDIHYPALISYLVYRYIAGEDSIWKGVKRLKPGSFLCFDLNRNNNRQECYWRLPEEQENWKGNDALEQFEALLRSSVQSRLISDVPLGVFLSGGYDSSAITATAVKDSPNLNTFSIGFEGSKISELSDAWVVAKHLKTNHRQEEVGHRNIENLKELFNYCDEPLGDSSIIPTFLLCQQAKKHVTVALAGDGGDELFGGYNWYSQFRKIIRFGPIINLIKPLLTLLGRRGMILRKADNPFALYRKLTSPRF